jgi:hypothetical protein
MAETPEWEYPEVPLPAWLGEGDGPAESEEPPAEPAATRLTQEEVFGLPVDPKAVEVGQQVAQWLNDEPALQPGGVAESRAQVITILTHPDGTVTVGVSGDAKTAAATRAVLERHLGELPPGSMIGPDRPSWSGGQAPCAEARAATGALLRDSNFERRPPPTGMATVPRDPDGKVATKYGDRAHPDTLRPCDSCAKHADAMKRQMGVPPNGTGG